MEEKRMEEEDKKSVYEKPLFEESESMKFPDEIWEKFNNNRFCIQCSGCHACRGG